ncbi:hypothetical protein FACS1894202_13420 [Clostridia bacterium]|nr:hypothetical protein FACS1894202_13420 [Clostridia bacterium]
MSQETTAIVRSILFQLEITDNIKAARRAVKAMCTKDDIAAVRELVAEAKADNTELDN